jgi:hypothetical protein
VDTASRLQGAQFDIAIVVHPLSGRRDATAFHLEAGRHPIACAVVLSAAIPAAILAERQNGRPQP